MLTWFSISNMFAYFCDLIQNMECILTDVVIIEN